ncbi:MAG: hypothetical protein DYG89_38415, partial [Caldilinea sp. CFX5]|nr:hypothetical protein [Caldilinea sp. CFX5]
MMIELLQLLIMFLVAVAFALALAHALELPGKMRLSQAVYYAVQPIYYPGFTIGGISEPVGLLLTLLLLWLTPWGSPDFWLTLLALAGLVGMQAVYWLVTHPVSAIGTSFGAILPHLAESRQVIAFELQGHGRTADIDRPMSMEAMADDVAAAVQQLGFDQV